MPTTTPGTGRPESPSVTTPVIDPLAPFGSGGIRKSSTGATSAPSAAPA